MTTQLTVYNNFDGIQRAAVALQKSGYFTDVKSEAQAIVKVLAGAELGLPPFASMTGIHIVQGKPVLGANVIATLVKNSGRYDYNIKTCTAEICIIEWYEAGKLRGESSFAMDEAQAAGLTGKDNWKKYPSDMLFARAISRGARRFAPGIFGGSPVYTPDEMNVQVDEDGYIEAEVVEPEPNREAQIVAELTGAAPQPVEPKDWPAESVKAVADDAGVHINRAKNALAYCKLPKSSKVEDVLAWSRRYKAARAELDENGKPLYTPAEAGDIANNG